MEYRFNDKGDWGIRIADVVLENRVTAEEIEKKSEGLRLEQIISINKSISPTFHVT